MFAAINGTRIYFDVEGAGSVPDGPLMRQKPVCFVLHGGPGVDHTGYKPYLTPLSDLMQLVYIDNRGSGLSAEGPQSTYTLENNVKDVEALRQYLGLDKIVILGQSYGGMTAESYAVAYPENVAGLILITTTANTRGFERAKKILREKGTEEQIRLAEDLWNGTFASNEALGAFMQATDSLYSYSYQAGLSEAELKLREEEGRRVRPCYQATNEGFKGALRSFNVVEQLKQITAPILIIAGRHDWITPVEDSIEIAEAMPNSQLVIFEQSSHLVMNDEYELFLATVRQFVADKLSGEASSHAQ